VVDFTGKSQFFFSFFSGAEVYSSELLLNGIVTQRLEYERWVLLLDNKFLYLSNKALSHLIHGFLLGNLELC